MFCKECGIEIEDSKALVCRNCGAKIDRVSEKSWLIALLLCFFLGCLGMHRFYLGKPLTGAIQAFITIFIGIMTMGYFAFVGLVWPLCDFFCILCERFNDVNDNPLKFKPLKKEGE